MELNYIQTRGGLFHALINLYQAMGGGWAPEEKKPPVALSEEKKE
jgi:outer membrane protein TolC